MKMYDFAWFGLVVAEGLFCNEIRGLPEFTSIPANPLLKSGDQRSIP